MGKLALKSSLRGAWGDWIGRQPWDLFVTLTSEDRTHPEAMLKRFRYCMAKASDHVYGRNWDRRGDGLQWVVGIERHLSGNPHCHAVVRFPMVDIRGADGRAIFDLGYWQQRFTDTGGFAWLELPRSEQAVVNYVTKYIVKDGDLELSPKIEFATKDGDQLLLLTGRDTPAPGVAPRSGAPRPPWQDPEVAEA